MKGLPMQLALLAPPLSSAAQRGQHTHTHRHTHTHAHTQADTISSYTHAYVPTHTASTCLGQTNTQQ